MFTDVRLQNFRSYQDESFELSPGVNIIVGPNASGKTNLLEAILVLSSGRSYRAQGNDLIRNESAWARLDAHTLAGNRGVKIVRDEPGNKSFIVDDKSYRRLSTAQSLPIVLFEPNNLWLFSGEPSLRREFLDNLLSQIRPGFGETLARYQRALKQRNALLKKQGLSAKPQLFAWDIRLSELGGQIAEARLELTKQMAEELPGGYSKLAGRQTKVGLGYKTRLQADNYSSDMLKQLQAGVELDILRGFTGSGPHRDDLELTITNRPMAAAASRGEARTLLLALKVIELKILEKIRQQPPLLLLDDVFSELDGRRRRAVTELLKKYQTFITTTDADAVVHHFTNNHNIIALSSKNKRV